MIENQENMENLDLIIKSINGEATPEEQKELNMWLEASPDNKISFEKYKVAWDKSSDSSADIQNINIDAEWQKMHSKMQQPKVVALNTDSIERKTKSQFFIRIAASVAIILGLSAIFFNPSDNEISAMAGVVEQNLPDGTEIALNKGAKLSYSNNFNEELREVELEGEANFEVAHNKQKPFIINTGSVSIKVLGTNFFVHAPKGNDDDREIIVKNGKVEVTDNRTGQKVILVEGQRAHYSVKAKKLEKSANKDANYLCWQTKVFQFRSATMTDIAQKLQQAYHVEITTNPVIRNCEMTFNASKLPLEAVIEIIEESSDIKFNKKADRYVIGGHCN